jgi:hypothetical protein
MKKGEFGVFEIVVPAVNGQPAIQHDSKIKVTFSILVIVAGLKFDRSPWLFQTIMRGKKDCQFG